MKATLLILMVIGIVGYLFTRSTPPFNHIFALITAVSLLLSFFKTKKSPKGRS